ncbi:DoxX-like family protein [Polaribacter vadi]|uniref:DoxX-like family protein n=1 Tax=Polaribacter TaxID=52959 RepID=UPI001C0A1BDF|nr:MULTISPECIES: DoxX-like family protein [Polaribacter]MBU3010638.1 DoxX-like family protein [Polaribacter vadi]MDO6740449.1 DoxX-like family protein [Polaribacter sp. 1_MG-2023]
MKTKKLFTNLIAFVWFINGFFCKTLNFTQRHQEIVGRILNEKYSREITFTIGILEILMTIWILSGIKSRINSITQIAIVITMNVIEFIMAEDILLFGKLNILFALFFCSIVYYKEFIIKNKDYV